MEQENRLIDLESRVAHQDQAILEMSEEIFRQQQQLALLEGRWRSLLERVDSLSATPGTDAGPDEVPPHY